MNEEDCQDSEWFQQEQTERRRREDLALERSAFAHKQLDEAHRESKLSFIAMSEAIRKIFHG